LVEPTLRLHAALCTIIHLGPRAPTLGGPGPAALSKGGSRPPLETWNTHEEGKRFEEGRVLKLKHVLEF